MRAIRFARSASKHRISRDRATYVIDRCGLMYSQPPPDRDPDDNDERLVFLGDDWNGVALEVMAIEAPDGDLLVIHAQKLRPKYRNAYERVRGYQT
ncbi:MAG: hypothetical protein NVSMB29_10180 [Candidatus Dormibacteria bacterium]